MERADQTSVLSHVSALDGVRGVAILLVLGYHGGHGVLVGGWQGVTVFFVLSGFLITSVLAREADVTGAVGAARFYRRRLARLGPALGVVLLVETLWVLADGLPGRRQMIVQGLAASLTSTANLVTAFAGPAPLGDAYGWSWSLSIEEQFYLLWVPVLIVGLRRAWSARRLLVLLAVPCIMSLTWRTIDSFRQDTDFLQAHYGTVQRMDALLVGCMLALVVRAGWMPRAIRYLGVPSLAVLIYIARFGSESAAWSYALQMPLVIVASGCLIATVVVSTGGLTGRFLSTRLLVRLGQLSYGLYLWNVFVRDFIASALGDPAWYLPPLALVLWLGSTYLVAEASWRYVETPLRERIAPKATRVSPEALSPAATLSS